MQPASLAPAEPARQARLRAWLSTARCRLSAADYAAFRDVLKGLKGAARPSSAAEFSAEESAEVRALAALLWRADFPEGGQAQLAWLEGFRDSLQVNWRARWRDHILEAAPSHLALEPAATESGSTVASSGSQAPTSSASTKAASPGAVAAAASATATAAPGAPLSPPGLPSEELGRALPGKPPGEPRGAEPGGDVTASGESVQTPPADGPAASRADRAGGAQGSGPARAWLIETSKAFLGRRNPFTLEAARQGEARDAGALAQAAGARAASPSTPPAKRLRQIAGWPAEAAREARGSPRGAQETQSAASSAGATRGAGSSLEEDLRSRIRELEGRRRELEGQLAAVEAGSTAAEHAKALVAQVGRELAPALAARSRALPQCIICKEFPERPSVAALCGHFACERCWKKWMAVKFECPVCRSKVRPGNLVRLQGWRDE